MKKIIIGSIVGGLLIFFWQTLSWTVLDLHRPAQDYHPKQDSIMQFLNSTLDKEGGYFFPTVPAGTSFEEANKMGEAMVGKPWASIQYHKSYEIDANTMMMNMGRGLLTCMFIVGLLIWIINKWEKKSFSSVLLACLFTGLIIYLNEPYNYFIWYKSFDIRAHLYDAIISWGLCGVWLGWWLSRKAK